MYFRSIIFWILTFLTTIIIALTCLPFILLKDKKLVDNVAKFWALCLVFFLKYICNIDHKILGTKHLPKTPYIIASKHQSMWDTIIMLLIDKRPVYILKKELCKIPFYGWYVKNISTIPIDRKGGATALKNMIKECKKYLNNKQNIIIFPQGTRTPPRSDIADFPYQSGITAIYSSCKVPVAPVALNSGSFWGKGFIFKKTGTITLEFLPAIKPGLSKDDFIKKLQEDIENKSKELEDGA